MSVLKRKLFQRPRFLIGATFVASLLLCSILISIAIVNRSNVDKLQMEQLILEKSKRINEVVSSLLYKTEALSAMVILGDGDIEEFNLVASIIIDDPSILNMLIAPDGVVSKVYPHNDTLVGLNFFREDDWAGNREAIAARDSGELVLGGPFVVAQGVPAIVGRKPVYITRSDEREFWGLVSITLAFPEALDGAELGFLEASGYSYELWRIDPDTEERQIIANSDKHNNSSSRYIEKPVTIFNADWHLRVAPIRVWYSYPENIVLIIAGLLISFLIALVVHKSIILRKVAITDALTGIYNRRFFVEISHINIKRAQRINAKDFIFIFDIDHFKKINDSYGHDIGDKVLVEVTQRIRDMLRPYDIFARYGGEEFVIYVSDMEYKSAYELAERLRLKICEKEFKFENVSAKNTGAGNVSFRVTTSVGLAEIIHKDDISVTIKSADEALYAAKKDGRNRVKTNMANNFVDSKK